MAVMAEKAARGQGKEGSKVSGSVSVRGGQFQSIVVVCFVGIVGIFVLPSRCICGFVVLSSKIRQLLVRQLVVLQSGLDMRASQGRVFAKLGLRVYVLQCRC